MSYWQQQIFNYCERMLNSAFWAEPLNALTNITFFVAAIAAFVLWWRAPRVERRTFDLLLILLVAIIGTGSFLFHTFATRWSILADTIPIGLFIWAYTGYAIRKYFGLGWFATFAGIACVIAALYFAGAIPCDGKPCLNGSASYMPALFVLLLFGIILYASAHPAGPSLIAAGVIFAVSLVFRTLDHSHCAETDLGWTGGPIGLHFIWHVLNAILLFVLLRSAIRYGGFTAAVRNGDFTAAPPRDRSI